MTNNQINEIRGTSTVGSQNKAYVDDALQIQQETVVSSKGKKTKSFVFNKRLADAPNIENYDVNGKTLEQLLALYYTLLAQGKTKLLKQLADQDPDKLGQMYLTAKDSDKVDLLKDIATNTSQGTLVNIYQTLPDVDKGKFLLGVLTTSYDTLTPEQAEAVNQLIAQVFNSYVNGLSPNDKAKFLKALSSTVQKLTKDTSTLSEKEKAQLQQFIVNSNNPALQGNQNSKDRDDDEHYGNIMMIIVKAFNDGMNTEGLDEISQINDTKLINKFLQIAQNILQTNLQNQQKINNDLEKNNSNSWVFWVTIAVIVLVAVVCIVLPVISFVGADAALGVIGTETEEAFTAEELSEGVDLPEISADSTVREPLPEDEEVGLPKIDDVPSETPNGTVTNDTSTVENNAQTTLENNANKAESDAANNIGKAEQGGEKGVFNSITSFFKGAKTTIGNKIPRLTLKEDAGPRIWGNCKSAFTPTIAVAGGSYVVENMISPNITPHGEVPLSPSDSAKMNEYQILSQYENNVVNQNNNVQQTVSKRISDDSEKTQQDSGFVQQAINMFGQAMQFRV